MPSCEIYYHRYKNTDWVGKVVTEIHNMRPLLMPSLMLLLNVKLDEILVSLYVITRHHPRKSSYLRLLQKQQQQMRNFLLDVLNNFLCVHLMSLWHSCCMMVDKLCHRQNSLHLKLFTRLRIYVKFGKLVCCWGMRGILFDELQN